MRFIGLLALFLASPALAQDHGTVAKDVAQVHNDVGDLERLQAAIRDWKLASIHHDAGEKAADQEIVAWVKAELAEDHREVAENRSELGAAKSEARGPGAGDDRDRAGDRTDLDQALTDRRREHEIAGELRDLQPAFAGSTATPEQYTRKKALLEELSACASREITRSQREVHEDVGERHEDHHH